MRSGRQITHEFDGRKYEKASNHQKEWGSRLVADLGLRGSEHVLDLGCGAGGLTVQLAARVPRGAVLGVDASKGMIEVARTKACPTLTFRRWDINDLVFDSRFDVVFSNATLHWIKDHTRLLANVRRALRSSGRVRFNFAGERMILIDRLIHGFHWHCRPNDPTRPVAVNLTEGCRSNVVAFVVALFVIKLLWAWTVPDLFPGAVEQGLVAGSLSWLTAAKLAIFMAVLSGISGGHQAQKSV
jgi:ubiquinone/menaquinone biosynthesis C-methylase UbiE